MSVARLSSCMALMAAMALLAPAHAMEGLVGYWPLDEGAGNTLDELSGHSRAAVSEHDLLWDGDEGGATLRFERARQREVYIPSSSAWDYAPEAEGDLTICFQAKLEEPGWVVDHRFGGIPGAWGFLTEGRALIFSVYLDKPWTDERKSVKLRFGEVLGKWHHIALVWKRGKDGWLKGYVDGEQVAAVSDVPVTASYVHPLALGGRNGGQFGWSTGSLRELAIFSRTLSAAEAGAIARAGIHLAVPLAVSSLRTDKVLYRPSETATISLRLRNASREEQHAALTLKLVSHLQDERPLLARNVALPPGGNVLIEEQAALAGLDYGCEVRATLTMSGQDIAEKREFFQVADDLWQVGIGSSFGSALHTGLGRSLAVPALARERYANYFELFFWSPGDWSRHIAPAKKWWSGQACYPQDEDQLTELIERAHARGIRVAMYASCNPAGPFAWETAREHPDWFIDARHKLPTIPPDIVEQLDNWNDPEFRKTHGNPQWVVVPPDLRREEVLDYGIDRIIESAKRYKWDAVRFDGHYTIRGFDEVSARNMRRLKERVWAELPDFQFGYNYGRAPEWKEGVTHEMREGMAGGGLYLQEGIRRWRYTAKTYTNWQHYATNELRVAKLIQGMGGHYHCMWEGGNHPAPEAYYKFVYGLIAGGHPAVFDGKVPLSPAWGAFMTRWSGLLWRGNFRPTMTEGIALSDPTVQWRGLGQEAVLDAKRKLVVVHLVNPPATDAIEGTEFPPPRSAFEVTYTPAAGARVVRARLVSPAGLPFDRDVALPRSGRTLSVPVPALKHWAMLTLELTGSFDVPPPSPRHSEPPDPEQIERALKGTITARTIDPNKEDVIAAPHMTAGDGVIYETNRGYSGVPAQTIADAHAGDGLAQVQSYAHMSGGHSARFMGRSWLTMLQPGRHRVSYRVRWTGDAPDQFWKAYLYVTVPNQEGGKERTFHTNIASPNCWENEAGKAFLGQPQNYGRLGTDGAYAYCDVDVEVRFPTYISACAIVDTNRDGPHRFYMDHIRISLVEPYSDAHLETWLTVDKPAALRPPGGGKPERILEVRGVQARPYGVSRLPTCDTAYDLPNDYRPLYAYDTAVLVNFDCAFTSWRQRRILRDFVADGGRLVVLGGIATLGQGAMRNTYLEGMLPVSLRGDGEVVPCAPPPTLSAGRGEPGANGQVFWVHDVAPRAGADVLAWAGERPVALSGSFGAGTVRVFTGTTLGGSGGGEAFWDTPFWADLLRRMARE